MKSYWNIRRRYRTQSLCQQRHGTPNRSDPNPHREYQILVLYELTTCLFTYIDRGGRWFLKGSGGGPMILVSTHPKPFTLFHPSAIFPHVDAKFLPLTILWRMITVGP